ncbi:HAD-IIIC family phosphatase [Longimicrobium terrae]|uniref:FkbH-like protein n=1 Tax=Longimicrobium terrae TaxID=1639882 RepID=A0A841H2H6_9BACT|nr:FkbH-like protein [Longimicrobium terrae]MBB6072200.1 FkbH-like protein [Longimicrobium terrae]
MTNETLPADAPASDTRKPPKTVKCVVWDLDHTIWNGILLEDDTVELRPGVAEILRTLDERGILQSVASRNDHDRAMARLQALGIADYFLYPHINWNAKGQNVEAIATALNIGQDTFLFVDDQPFEREEVAFACPAVRTLDAAELDGMLERPELNPEFITEDSRNRRRMYQADIDRGRAEETFNGPSEEFLRTLDMRFTLGPCTEADLQRAEELTVRTNQLNTTGRTYGYDELNAFRTSSRHLLLVAGLDDRYGGYGKIGLALVEKTSDAVWTLKLLLMSCRVMSRGVGTIMMSHVMNEARAAGARLRAEFKPNGRNRMMEVTYRFGGFREVERDGDLIVFEHDLAAVQPFPEFVRVHITR